MSDSKLAAENKKLKRHMAELFHIYHNWIGANFGEGERIRIRNLLMQVTEDVLCDLQKEEEARRESNWQRILNKEKDPASKNDVDVILRQLERIENLLKGLK